MVEDDVSAGFQDEEMTRHHSSSLRVRAPVPVTHHPHQCGSDTLTHRSCRPPGPASPRCVETRDGIPASWRSDVRRPWPALGQPVPPKPSSWPRAVHRGTSLSHGNNPSVSSLLPSNPGQFRSNYKYSLLTGTLCPYPAPTQHLPMRPLRKLSWMLLT